MRGSDEPLRDPEAHAGARRPPGRRAPSSEEPIEHVRQIASREPRAMVAHSNEELRAGKLAGHVDRRAARGILGGVFQQMRQRRRGQPGVETHQGVRLCGDEEAMLLQRLVDLLTSGGDDLRGMRPSLFGRHSASIEPRHVQHVVEQTREALDFGKNQVALLGAILRG